MTQAQVNLILGLIPVADSIIFRVGSELLEMSSENLTKEELIKAIEASKSESWPELKFVSPR